MKKFYRSISLFLAAALGLCAFGGCGHNETDTDALPPVQDTEDGEQQSDVPPIDVPDVPSEGDPDQPSADEPDNPHEKEPDEPSEDDPDQPPAENPDIPPEDDPEPPEKDPSQAEEAARYGYRPTLFNETPTVSIATANGSNDFLTLPTREWKLDGRIAYVAAEISVANCPEELQFTAAAEIKAYGNDALDHEKKSVCIRFNEEASMLGLNGGQTYRNWVLLADPMDLSSLRSATAFYLGNAVLGSDGLYCSDFCTVEVYLNGEYWGVYLLAKEQEASDGRAGTASDDPGGVLLEYGGSYVDEIDLPDGDPVFTVDFPTLRKYDGSLYEPWQSGFTVKSGNVSDTQLGFLQTDVQNAFGILYAAAYEGRALRLNDDRALEAADCTPREAVEAAIDLPSLIDTYILQEIFCDPDIAWSGFCLSLGRREGGRKKLTFEAPWDHDSSFGIERNAFSGALGVSAGNSENPWLTVLLETDWFLDEVKEKWEALKKYGVFETALALIGTQSELSQAAYARNLTRWGEYGGSDELVWEAASFSSQAEAAEYLGDWLHARLNFLNGIFSDGSDILTGEPVSIPSSPDPSLSPVTFEAESCTRTGTIRENDFYAGASGGKYLGGLETAQAGTVTLRVYAAKEQTVYLSIGLSKRSFAADLSDWFALNLNGKRLFLPLRPIEACKIGETDRGTWTEVFLAPVLLHAGENTLTLSIVGSGAANLDYFRLYCEEPTQLSA